ncbi:hypothetical protein [Streptococcus pneumoniae]|uniref:hypothetical protein n=1 Tax=Streptococcus pneumoniae TaxID=1313 RepID=UPI00214DD80C|nr:hypothetical protein [Streptococcus pneumoniae]
MKIKEQTRKLAVSCSKHCFEVVDGTDEATTIPTASEADVQYLRKVTLTWFEEIFESIN